MPKKKELSLSRIAAVFVLISVLMGAYKAGIPQAIFQVGFNELRSGMDEVTRKQREKLERQQQVSAR